MRTHVIPNPSRAARTLQLVHRASPETTPSSILELAAHDLDAAFSAARRHLRAHPDDAHLLGLLASTTPTDPNASTKFREFVGDVVADAIAEEHGVARRADCLARSAR